MQKTMKKKLFHGLLALVFTLCMMTGGLAAQTYRDMNELYQHWSETQMPDWVCSVVSADGSSERLAVVVSSQAAADELAAMVEDGSSVEIIVADGSYGYNELLRVQDEISRKYMKDDGTGPVVSIGTGLAVIDGEVVGFGESGKELRVVVGVPAEYADEYRERFQKEYADMVYVEVQEGMTLNTDMALQQPAMVQPVIYVLAGVVLLGIALTVGIFLRRKQKTER